ncbi:helix-turn-helix domain-containing protein [Limosilactobacillus reuteri]|uniref:helix-turn-helix domain-containing protein n=1 Tax=Limosilactobacillus reuteri TaxID=1598 RepID=UPI002B05CDA7|nr:helix-turn-helix transcriptional regulator [Limosilactobacillus reuteri]
MRITSNRIKELRKQNKLTLKQLSEKSGISVSSLSAYEKEEGEKGYRSPKFDKWIKLANFFGVSVSYLMGEDSETVWDLKASKDDKFEKLSKMLTNPKTEKIAIKIFEHEQEKKNINDFASILSVMDKIFPPISDERKNMDKVDYFEVVSLMKDTFDLAIESYSGNSLSKKYLNEIVKILKKYREDSMNKEIDESGISSEEDDELPF